MSTIESNYRAATTHKNATRVSWYRFRDVPGYITMIVLCTLILIPFTWMILTSFKPKEEVFKYPPTFFPQNWTLNNYQSLLEYPGLNKTGIKSLADQGVDTSGIYPTDEQGAVLKNSSMWRVYWNILRIVFFSSIGAVLVSGLSGYAFAKIKFPGREVLFILLLTTIMVPWMTLLLPRYLLFRDLGWTGTPKPLYIPDLLFGMPLAIFFFRQHFRSIPNELLDAARIDGAGHLRIFLRILLPMSKSVIFAVIILTILTKWNDLLGPIIYLDDTREYTPAQVVYKLSLAIGNERDPSTTGLRMAASVLVVAPIVLFFLFAQRFFVAGLTQCALKE